MALGLFSSHVYNTHDEIRLKIRLLGCLHQASDTIMDSLSVLYLRKGPFSRNGAQWCTITTFPQCYGFEDHPVLTLSLSRLGASVIVHRVTWNPEMPSDFISECYGHFRVPDGV